jgi:DNA repair protein RecN (Recombination protein N)
MIKFLRIRNLATIEDIQLNLDRGFSILTGETGAGKSIIIDSIRLLLGEKGSADLIRTGKSEATVEAIFYFPPGKGIAREVMVSPDEEILVQRQLSEQGGKAYLDGVLVPVKKLKETGGSFADIYGQNDHIFLLHLENHLNYLDSYSEALELREDVAHAAQALRRLIRQKADLEARARERTQRLDFLSYQISEIEKAHLRPGEEEQLHAERNILKNAEKIASLIEKALDISYAQENSLLTQVARLQNIIAELGPFDKTFEETKGNLNELAITLQELADFLIHFKEKQADSPEKLEELEERLSLIEKLKRKYGNTVTEILSFLEKIKADYEELSLSQEKLEGLETEISAAFEDYLTKAGRLSRARKKGADELEKQVEKEIALLGMKKAKFEIQITPLPLSKDDQDKVRENGLEEVEFLISPNPGEQLRPLRKIASGGELSRIMLALKTIGKEKESWSTLIFDEIDSGIGGKTAEFIAQKLRELASRHQIICITHLPQIASFASHHYRIEKKVEKERTYTLVKKLSFEERVEEIARLISGSQITGTSLLNAREMLERNFKA